MLLGAVDFPGRETERADARNAVLRALYTLRPDFVEALLRGDRPPEAQRLLACSWFTGWLFHLHTLGRHCGGLSSLELWARFELGFWAPPEFRHLVTAVAPALPGPDPLHETKAAYLEQVARAWDKAHETATSHGLVPSRVPRELDLHAAWWVTKPSA